MGETVLVVCDTHVKHELASTEYNTRRAECEEGVRRLQKYLPAIKSLRDVSQAEFARFGKILPEHIMRRCRHIITENVRTLEAAGAFERKDFVEAGCLMLLSHESLRDDYQVSCTELDALVEIARKIEGVHGARMTGGGFGGCTVNLLENINLPEFIVEIERQYSLRFGIEPTVHTFQAGAGACEIKNNIL